MSIAPALGKTTGQIARELDDAAWRVQRVIKAHRIPAVAQVGTFRLYAPEAVEQIKRHLDDLAARRDAAAAAV